MSDPQNDRDFNMVVNLEELSFPISDKDISDILFSPEGQQQTELLPTNSVGQQQYQQQQPAQPQQYNDPYNQEPRSVIPVMGVNQNNGNHQNNQYNPLNVILQEDEEQRMRDRFNTYSFH